MLNLNNNQIRYLVGGTFNKLKQLRVLKLNNNTINRLLPKAFVHLSQLEVINWLFYAAEKYFVNLIT